MTLDIGMKRNRKQNRYLNIRVNDTFIQQLNYLRNRSGYLISKSEVIRRIVEDEYNWAVDLDRRSE